MKKKKKKKKKQHPPLTKPRSIRFPIKLLKQAIKLDIDIAGVCRIALAQVVREVQSPGDPRVPGDPHHGSGIEGYMDDGGVAAPCESKTWLGVVW